MAMIKSTFDISTDTTKTHLCVRSLQITNFSLINIKSNSDDESQSENLAVHRAKTQLSSKIKRGNIPTSLPLPKYLLRRDSQITSNGVNGQYLNTS